MVRIRHLLRTDIDTVLSWQEGTNADDLFQWAGPGYVYPLTTIQIEERLVASKVKGVHSGTFIFAIEDAVTGILVGIAELSMTDKEKGVGSIGKVLIGHKVSRGKGYCKNALTKIIGFAFTELGLNRLLLKVFESNTSAIKCYENLGFHKVRYEKNAYKSVQGYWHRYYMILDKEQR